MGFCMMSLPVWLSDPMFLLGVSVPAPMLLSGGICLGVFLSGVSLSRGFFVQGDVCRETPTDRDSPLQWTCGLYASYWNAGLFLIALGGVNETCWQINKWEFSMCRI